MDCHYHDAVPAVAPCRDCREPICATCRDDAGTCPGCRLGERIGRKSAESALRGGRGPSRRRARAGAGGTGAAGGEGAAPRYASAAPRVRTIPLGELADVPLETRALVALGYPFWPVAVLALLDPARRPAVRRQALQAIGFNVGLSVLWTALLAIAHVPLLGISAWPLVALLVPVWVVGSILLALSVARGNAPRVPLIAEWLDRHGEEIGAAV